MRGWVGVCGDVEELAIWGVWRWGGEIWVYGDHILIAGPING